MYKLFSLIGIYPLGQVDFALVGFSPLGPSTCFCYNGPILNFELPLSASMIIGTEFPSIIASVSLH